MKKNEGKISWSEWGIRKLWLRSLCIRNDNILEVQNELEHFRDLDQRFVLFQWPIKHYSTFQSLHFWPFRLERVYLSLDSITQFWAYTHAFMHTFMHTNPIIALFTNIFAIESIHNFYNETNNTTSFPKATASNKYFI